MAYAYSDAGLRTSTAPTIDGVADYVDEYAYDCEGRLVSIAQYGAAGSSAVADKQISLGCNDQGLLATVTRYTDGNLAVQAQYTYDSAGRLTALVYSQGETILASYAWTYDTAADSVPSSSDQPSDINPQTSLQWLPSGGIMPGQDTTAIVDALWEGTATAASLITEMTSVDGAATYTYDGAGQLVSVTYTTGQTDETYAYDANGNRITAGGATYITGTNNQLLYDGVYSYLYDPEGNRTARFIDSNANGLLDAGDMAATTYAWDHRNRLTCVTDYDLYGDPATRAVDYLYDVENRWIGRDVDLDADGIIDTRTRFAYDGNQIVLQFDRAAAPTGDPADPLTVDDLSHRYLWDPAAVDQLMADEQVTDPDIAGDIVWPLGNHQGTIRDLAVYDPATDATTVVNHRTFDAYGNLQSQTTTAVDCLFAYTGRPLDQTTGLQNNLHRWYDPAVGRWMSEDPIGFEGRDGNLYVYVGNGPVNARDPSGLISFFDKQLSTFESTERFLVAIGKPRGVTDISKTSRLGKLTITKRVPSKGDVYLSGPYSAQNISMPMQTRYERRRIDERLYLREVKFQITEVYNVWEIIEVVANTDGTYTCRAKLVERLAVVNKSTWAVYRYRERFTDMMDETPNQSLWTLFPNRHDTFRPKAVSADSWLYLKLYPKTSYRILPGYEGRIPPTALERHED